MPGVSSLSRPLFSAKKQRIGEAQGGQEDASRLRILSAPLR